MIVVDTNIISELMQQSPTPQVLDWFTLHQSDHLFITSITLAEIRYGLRIMPDGKRKQLLSLNFKRYIDEAFNENILNFTDSAASVYADIMGQRKELGLPMSMADGQIASVAKLYDFAVATRNTKDFVHCGIELLNPFE